MHSDPAWTHGYLSTNGVRLHYVTQGEGPLMLLLHGFPEFWYSWRHQISEFANSYKVVAVDLRGYNESDKPVGKESYRLPILVDDIKGMIHQLTDERCILVGHDWGGVIAWALAESNPELLAQLIILNAPHPAKFREHLKTPSQFFKSWYIFVFQLPFLPEWILGRRNYSNLVQILTQTVVSPEAYSPQDIAAYRQAAAKPGALNAMLNYYRNLFQDGLKGHWQVIEVPTLLIWGENDVALDKALTFDLQPYVRNLSIRYLPDCSHWVQQEKPEIVNQYIHEWLKNELM